MQFIRSAQRKFGSMSSNVTGSQGPIQTLIQTRITDSLAPVHLEIENESYKHNVPKGSESHFKVFVVSELFQGKSLLERHRLVTNAVKGYNTELPIHALSIQAKTPEQWNTGATMHSTPNCLGGSKK